MKYYLWKDSQETGPFTLEMLQVQLRSGTIRGDQPARSINSTTWARVEDLLAQAPRASRGTFSAERKRVTRHLRRVRDNTCYGALRMLIDISFIITLLIFIGIAGFMLVSRNSFVLALYPGGGVVLAIASRQFLLLFVDMADTLLQRHAKEDAEARQSD
jgi:hypothetical protein